MNDSNLWCRIVNLTNVMLSADLATGDVKVKRGVWQAK